MIVQFVRPYALFNAGERATLPVDRAEKLIAVGVAIAVTTPEVEEPVEVKRGKK